MAYVLGLFPHRADADRAAAAIEQAEAPHASCRTSGPATRVGAWLAELAGGGHEAGRAGGGLPPEDARWYEEEVRRGRVLLVARTEQDPARVAQMMRELGAADARAYGLAEGAWVRQERAPEGAGGKTYERAPYTPGAPSGGPAAERARESGYLPERDEDRRGGGKERGG